MSYKRKSLQQNFSVVFIIVQLTVQEHVFSRTLILVFQKIQCLFVFYFPPADSFSKSSPLAENSENIPRPRHHYKPQSK